jgi:PilZ domain
MQTGHPFAPVCYYHFTFGPVSPPFHERHSRMPPDGTRRSGRIPKQIAINLFGSDMEGRIFSERTKTVVLSRHGAGIVSTYKLSAEQELVVRSEESHLEIEARVVGQIGADGDTYIYGIAFLDRTVNFWGIDFPDLSETEQRASKTLLECCSCRSREIADHSDLASDVMAVNDSIMRYCGKCGFSTLWRQADPGGATSGELEEPTRSDLPVSAGSFDPTDRAFAKAKQRTSSFGGAAWRQTEESEPATLVEGVESNASVDRSASILPPGDRAEVAKAEAPEAANSGADGASKEKEKERENRRKHVRTRVNFKACVRRPGFADDVVACEDMSRGGLRFKTSRQYFEKSLIEVAVPYSPGDQAIFVPAQIAYVQELPEQKMYRCGVTYLRGGRR